MWYTHTPHTHCGIKWNACAIAALCYRNALGWQYAVSAQDDKMLPCHIVCSMRIASLLCFGFLPVQFFLIRLKYMFHLLNSVLFESHGRDIPQALHISHQWNGKSWTIRKHLLHIHVQHLKMRLTYTLYRAVHNLHIWAYGRACKSTLLFDMCIVYSSKCSFFQIRENKRRTTTTTATTKGRNEIAQKFIHFHKYKPIALLVLSVHYVTILRIEWNWICF